VVDQRIPRPTGRDDRILDRAMWYFWSKVLQRDLPEIDQIPYPQTPGNEMEPESIAPKARLTVATRLPQWINPNFWANNYSDIGETCLLFYKTWYTVYTHDVPDTRIVLIDRVSYEIPNLPINEVFEVQILRNGMELVRWEDMKVSVASANPAEQYALGGHFLPIPTWCRFDQSDRVVVNIQVLGPEAPAGTFPRLPTDPLNCYGKVVVQGHQATMLNRSSGVPRPADPGYLLDAYGNPTLDTNDLMAAAKLMQEFMR
jgi:hypothetical protein